MDSTQDKEYRRIQVKMLDEPLTQAELNFYRARTPGGVYEYQLPVNSLISKESLEKLTLQTQKLEMLFK